MTQSNGARLLREGSPPSDPEIDQLLHPNRFYDRPGDVVADHLLTVKERRAILSSWASDACAVDSNPALRQPPHASAPVTFDEIMDALLELDRLNGTQNMPWPGLKLIRPPIPDQRCQGFDEEPHSLDGRAWLR